MTTTAPRPRTAIIGAGISGLTAGKMLSDYGIAYDCFESSDRIGGNWAFGNPNGHSSAYRSLHIDTSKERLSFKDFPMPKEFPDFPHHTQIKDYLERYAEAFNLKRNIHFRNGVEHARRNPDGGWTLRTQDGQDREYDFLVVANGHHWDPRYPDFPGTFTGESIHSHQYIDPSTPLNLTGKRVLVVGIGNSAADIISELSQKTFQNTVYMSTRSGAWIVPKYMFGMPTDRLARTLPQIPAKFQRLLLRKVPTLISGPPERYGLPRPDHNFLEAHPTQSSELLLRLGSGDVKVKPNIERLDGQTVHFVDGTQQDFDAIVYATGYNISFPFFDEDFISAPDNKIRLFKRILKPGMDDIAFIGFAQAVPTLFPFVECQSRFLAAYLAGTYRPPSTQEMERIIDADDKANMGHFADRPRHTQQLDYYRYVYDIEKKEMPAGTRRAAKLGPLNLVGKVPA